MENKLEISFLKKLRENNFEISENAVCKIYRDRILLGIAKDEKNTLSFGSDITFYSSNNGEITNEISFGSSGAFTPEDAASYWRTIHSASLLKNWRLACEIVNEYVEFLKKNK